MAARALLSAFAAAVALALIAGSSASVTELKVRSQPCSAFQPI